MRIGYELECGIDDYGGYENDDGDWVLEDNEDLDKFLEQTGFTCGSDGSISTSKYAIEFKSKVYSIDCKKDLQDIENDFKYLSTLIKDINSSMGLHFHISFEKSIDYFKLCNFDFCDRFVKQYLKLFKYEREQSRIDNQYCRQYNSVDFPLRVRKQIQGQGKSGYRYAPVNFNSFNLYKTIEFRIFPATKYPSRFKKYLSFLYNFVTNYLKEDSNWKDLKVRALCPRLEKSEPIEIKEELDMKKEVILIKCEYGEE